MFKRQLGVEIITEPMGVETNVLRNLCIAIAGSLFIALCAAIRIQGIYIPFTLQTFALFVLALTLSPKLCFMTTVLYLMEATLGLPVVGKCNPVWFVFPTAGYLLAFPIATPLMAFLVQRSRSGIQTVMSLMCGMFVIHLGGWLFLSLLIGCASAWKLGVIPFVISSFLKMGCALGFVSGLKRSKL